LVQESNTGTKAGSGHASNGSFLRQRDSLEEKGSLEGGGAIVRTGGGQMSELVNCYAGRGGVRKEPAIGIQWDQTVKNQWNMLLKSHSVVGGGAKNGLEQKTVLMRRHGERGQIDRQGTDLASGWTRPPKREG